MIGPRIKHRRRASLLLLALCIGIATVIYVEVDQAAFEPPANAPMLGARAVGRTGGNEPIFAMPPLRSYAGVLERPLFSQTRRPPRETVAGVSSSGFILVGIVTSSHERHALIAHGKPPHLDRVAEDQDLDGWTVEAILEDRVVLRHANTRMEVKATDAPPNPPQRSTPQPPSGSSTTNNPTPPATSGIQPVPQAPMPK